MAILLINNKLIMKKTLISIGITIFILSGFLFYWYELRPVQIKKTCFLKVQEMDKNRESHFSSIEFKRVLDICVKGKGL